MNILVHDRSNLDSFTEYFDFNNIPYIRTEFFSMVSEDDQQFLLPCDSSKQLVIVDTLTFQDILSCDISYDHLLKYINNNNVLWISDQHDATLNLHRYIDCIKELDLLIPKNSIVLWMDAEPVSPTEFLNISIEYNLYTFVYMPRIKNAVFTKNNQSRDFFITTILKKNREHRKILSHCLNKRPTLLENSLTYFHEFVEEKYINYIGDKNTQHGWHDGQPSMDLYSNAFIEVVPETLCENYHFITEKTIKPIATKTLFLVCATPGYLGFLKKLGFQTFESIIDESYDNEVDLVARIEKMLDSLEYIVKNNTADFYKASVDILDHNYNKLCELSSKRQSIFDHAVHAQLNYAKQYLKNS